MEIPRKTRRTHLPKGCFGAAPLKSNITNLSDLISNIERRMLNDEVKLRYWTFKIHYSILIRSAFLY